MGMYDYINGEQVKCFDVVIMGNDGDLWRSGGSLDSYSTGNEVPYKKLHYNYTKNFIVLDINRFPECNDSYKYIVHEIKDGKVVGTYVDNVDNKVFENSNKTVSYYGEEMNIHSNEDILNYIKETAEYKKRYNEIDKERNRLFKESLKYLNGLTKLENGSAEKNERFNKLKVLREQMNTESERIKEPLDKISKEYSSKWFVQETEDMDVIIKFGELLEIIRYSTDKNYSISEEKVAKAKEFINKIIVEKDNVIDKFKAWYCETEEEKEQVNKLIEIAQQQVE